MAVDLRSIIIEKALALFSTNGFEKTKVTDLMKALHLGKGTFYLYFKNKEELLLECINRVPEIILPMHFWNEIHKGSDYFKWTRQLRLMLETFLMFNGIINMVKLALGVNDPVLAQKAGMCLNTVNRAITKDTLQAMQDGIIRKMDPEFLSFILFGALETVGYWLMMDPNASSDKCAVKLMDFISKGLIKKNSDMGDHINHSPFDAKIEDLRGAEIQLRKIRFNKKPCIAGLLGRGKIKINPKDSGRIQFYKKGRNHVATVTMKTNEKITIIVDNKIKLSGVSPFGPYDIPITDLNQIIMDPERKIK